MISEAGADPLVVGLVYVAARAPDAGEDYTALAKRLRRRRPTRVSCCKAVRQSHRACVPARLRQGVDRGRARVLYAVQGRVSDTLFADKTTVAAWRIDAVLVRRLETGSHHLTGVGTSSPSA